MADAALRPRAEAAAAALPPLLVAAERVAASVMQGVHGRRRTGQGETFWQYRTYEPGEPAGRIDWRESAKAERLYVRETEWEAAQSLFLWCDSSASMDYASSRNWPSKRRRATLLTLALAAMLLRGGERVSLLGSGLAPAHGRATLDRVAHLLDGEARTAGLPEFEKLPRHGHMVWLSDFLAPVETINRLVARYADAGLKGHLFQVMDPAEESLPFNGRVRFEGFEDESPLLIGRVEGIRDQYIDKLRLHREALRAVTRLAGWSFGIHRTDAAPTQALLGLYRALAKD
ncbi:MAG TPA: DUF58 domain-containing protein [Stellaceae bacterium]|jgi:uncharacterized protein (DUF58 family)|nr:DUF58 domain-containing protein [Stellaceae bacterium]